MYISLALGRPTSLYGCDLSFSGLGSSSYIYDIPIVELERTSLTAVPAVAIFTLYNMLTLAQV